MIKKSLDIAIIGLHIRLPGAETPPQFVENLKNSQIEIRNHLPKNSSNEFLGSRAVIKDPDCFDAEFFSYSKIEARQLCPQHRLTLEGSWLALDNAGYPPGKTPVNTGVYASCSANPEYWYALMQEHNDPLIHYQLLLNNDKDFLATRVAYKLNLQGPCMTLQTGCSSSLVSLHQASRALQIGDCDMAVVSSACITLPIIKPIKKINGMIFSPTGKCKPFSKQADGTVGGMGIICLVLKRLKEAKEDNDLIFSVLKGSAVNNDGSNKASFTSPSVDSQIDVMHKALDMASVLSTDVSYIEGHGTGTLLGDGIEITALNEVYGNKRITPCYLGSVKANIGHLDTASGLASVAKVILSLRHQFLFPQPYHNSATSMLSPYIKLNNKLNTFSEKAYMAVNSLGVGGTNVHMIFESPPHYTQMIQDKLPEREFKRSPIPLPNTLIKYDQTDEIKNICIKNEPLIVDQEIYSKVLSAWNIVLGKNDWKGSDNFFKVGGESLSAISLIQHINEATGLSLSYVTLFDNPTLSDLTTYVKDILSRGSERIALGEEGDEFEFEEL